jgi:hypothetical protein
VLRSRRRRSFRLAALGFHLSRGPRSFSSEGARKLRPVRPLVAPTERKVEMEELAHALLSGLLVAEAEEELAEEAERARRTHGVPQKTIDRVNAHSAPAIGVIVRLTRAAPATIAPRRYSERIPRPRARATRTGPTRGPPDEDGESEPPHHLAPRCSACGAYVSRYCTTCLGSPDDVSVEELARGVAQVDRATQRRRAL